MKCPECGCEMNLDTFDGDFVWKCPECGEMFLK